MLAYQSASISRAVTLPATITEDPAHGYMNPAQPLGWALRIPVPAERFFVQSIKLVSLHASARVAGTPLLLTRNPALPRVTLNGVDDRTLFAVPGLTFTAWAAIAGGTGQVASWAPGAGVMGVPVGIQDQAPSSLWLAGATGADSRNEGYPPNQWSTPLQYPVSRSPAGIPQGVPSLETGPALWALLPATAATANDIYLVSVAGWTSD